MNLDFYARACELDEITLFVTPGEGTFHQHHQGVTTGGLRGEARTRLMADIEAEYRRLRGKAFRLPSREPVGGSCAKADVENIVPAAKSNKPIRILVVGCGNMGASHAMAYHTNPGFEICGLVSTGDSKDRLNSKFDNGYALYSDFDTAMHETVPDAVCISTYPDTHEEFSVKAFERGCHVFLEKPVDLFRTFVRFINGFW